MCGIGGVIKPKGITEEDVERIKKMSIALQSRGTDAYGVLIVKADWSMRVVKLPCTARQMWSQIGDFLKAEMLGAKVVLVHTRAATTGSPSNNKNNHPFVSSDGRFVFAHNGVIHGYTAIYSKNEPETDSYWGIFKPFLALIESGESVEDAIAEAVCEANGSAATWWYDKEKKKVYLFRKDNPCKMFVRSGEVWFASEKKHLEAAGFKTVFDTSTYTLYEIDAQTGDVETKDYSHLKPKRETTVVYYGWGEWYDYYSNSRSYMKYYYAELEWARDFLESIGYEVERTKRGWKLKAPSESVFGKKVVVIVDDNEMIEIAEREADRLYEEVKRQYVEE